MTTNTDNEEVLIEELPVPITPRTTWEEDMLVILADTPPVDFIPDEEEYIPEPLKDDDREEEL